MFWNRRVRFLTCSRNGKCLWKMKAGTRWRFWKPTKVENTHPHRVWDTSPICWGITSDSAKDPWAEQSGWTDVPDLDEICASMHAFTCQLASEYCAEAVYYLKNHSPTKAVESMTPFEAWMKKRTFLSHLCVFRCKTYQHVPKDEWGKLDKTKKCILMVLWRGEWLQSIMTPTKRGSASAEMWPSMRVSVVLSWMLHHWEKTSTWSWNSKTRAVFLLSQWFLNMHLFTNIHNS